MTGVVAGLYRYPVKGFTPEELEGVTLKPGAGLPFDRAYAIEDGPSGFDPEAPGHISKHRFTVLAKIPKVAQVRTRFDDVTGVFHAETRGKTIAAKLSDEGDRQALAAWMTEVLGADATGPLRVLPAPGAHRFYDHPQGLVSLINLASVADIESRIGRPVDPLRFRGNVHVNGWPAWAELEAENCTVTLGGVRFRVFAPIRRCVATHVDPARGVRDIEMLEILQREYGHALCGAYLHVEEAGHVRRGDDAVLV